MPAKSRVPNDCENVTHHFYYPYLPSYYKSKSNIQKWQTYTMKMAENISWTSKAGLHAIPCWKSTSVFRLQNFQYQI